MPQQQPLAVLEFIIPSITPGLAFPVPFHTERMLDGRVTDARVRFAVGRRDVLLELLVLGRRGFDRVHGLEIEVRKVRVERVDRLSVRIAGRLVRDDGLSNFYTNPLALFKNCKSR
jgi:hypothetical protein